MIVEILDWLAQHLEPHTPTNHQFHYNRRYESISQRCTRPPAKYESYHTPVFLYITNYAILSIVGDELSTSTESNRLEIDLEAPTIEWLTRVERFWAEGAKDCTNCQYIKWYNEST